MAEEHPAAASATAIPVQNKRRFILFPVVEFVFRAARCEKQRRQAPGQPYQINDKN